MGDSIQVIQRRRVGKDDLPQLPAYKASARERGGEPGFQRSQQGRVGLQQRMVDFIAVQHFPAPRPQLTQQGRLAAAGAAGDAQDHSSASASTMWKAAAFFSRFCTA